MVLQSIELTVRTPFSHGEIANPEHYQELFFRTNAFAGTECDFPVRLKQLLTQKLGLVSTRSDEAPVPVHVKIIFHKHKEFPPVSLDFYHTKPGYVFQGRLSAELIELCESFRQETLALLNAWAQKAEQIPA